MEKVFDRYRENLRRMGASGQTNALSAAAPLTKEEGIPVRPRQMQPEQASKPANVPPARTPTRPKRPLVQKIAIIAALLTVGALRPAIALITRFPWVVDSHPEISDLLLRILHVSLKSCFETYFPQDHEHSLQNSQPRQRWSQNGPQLSPQRKPSLTILAPTPISTMSSSFVFFYPAWCHGVPVCKNDDDIQRVVEPLVTILGLQIHRDLNFFSKLCQLARAQLLQKV
jgi:THO complex subunit 2